MQHGLAIVTADDHFQQVRQMRVQHIAPKYGVCHDGISSFHDSLGTQMPAKQAKLSSSYTKGGFVKDEIN